MSRHLWFATGLVSIASLASRFLGVYRDHLYAVIFGAAGGSGIFSLDTYYAAFRIPDFLYSILMYGAISAAFLPIFSAHKAKGAHTEAWQFASAVLSLLTVIVIFCALIFGFFADTIVPLLTPGFTGEKLAITVFLTRIMLFSTVFFSISSLFQSVSNAFHRYLSYALAPVLYNFSLIVSAWFFAPQYGVYALGWGVVIGAFLHMFIQLPTMYFCGFRFRFHFGWRRSDVRRLFVLTIPRIFGTLTTHVNVLVETIIASTLAAGSLTVFNYALNIQSLPVGMIGLAVSVVSFATFTDFVATHAYRDFLHTIADRVEKILFLVIPAAVGLWLLRTHIIALIFVGGAFTIADADLTAAVLLFLLPGVIAQSLIPLFSRALYALNNTFLPVLAGIFSFVINVCLSVYFVYSIHFGITGLALSNTVAAFFQIVLLMFFFRWYFPRATGHSARHFFTWRPFFATLFASTVMGVAVFFANHFLTPFLNGVSWIALLGVTMSITFGGAGVYFMVHKLLLLAFRSAKVNLLSS